MTLFDNLNSEVEFSSDYKAETLIKTQKVKAKFAFIDRTKIASEDIPFVEKGEQLIAVSCENFGASELLQVFIDRYDPVSVKITTWSINGTFVDILKKLLARGVRVAFNCDKSLKGRKSIFWNQVAELRYAHPDNFRVRMHDLLHAKVTILRNEEGDFISIEGSANYSKNTRIEQFIITNDEDRYRFHEAWIKKI